MAIDPSLLDSACQANIDENFNRVLGDISTAAGGVLPEIAAGDAGKVLTVNEDADGVEWASGVLPELPAEDGTYTLKVTVAEGEATLSWVADEA